MNRFTLGIFRKDEQNPRLVIRIVYALAARKSIVHVIERGRPSISRKGKNKAPSRTTITRLSTFGAAKRRLRLLA
jgi:hypothetical protein